MEITNNMQVFYIWGHRYKLALRIAANMNVHLSMKSAVQTEKSCVRHTVFTERVTSPVNTSASLSVRQAPGTAQSSLRTAHWSPPTFQGGVTVIPSVQVGKLKMRSVATHAARERDAEAGVTQTQV